MSQTDRGKNVIVDTCVWISYLEVQSRKKEHPVQKLLDRHSVWINGPIIFEILRGIKRKPQAEWLASELKEVPYLELHWDDWQNAADLHRTLIRNGDQLPMADLCIAAIAIRKSFEVYSTDPHFDLIPNLNRFDPNAQ